MTARRRAARAAPAVVLAVLMASCASPGDPAPGAPSAAAPTGADATSAPTGPVPDPAACPVERAEPDPQRPVVDLVLALDDDLRTVRGSQTVAFTPDLPTDELVFRLVPNAPGSGSELTVHRVRGADVAGSRYEDAGARTPGGLYVVVLDGELAAGGRTEVELDFTLRIGGTGFDRIGVDEGVTWWGSGAPLLAWEPGEGWARDPFVEVVGETTVSPAADTTVTVTAPEDLVVVMTGDTGEPSAPRGGRRTWTSTEPAARDVAVAVGELAVAEGGSSGGTRITVGSVEGDADAAELAGATAAAIDDLEDLLGPFPFATLSIVGLPDSGGGIEYPSAVLQASRDEAVLVHEVAHEWFYGMVGNSQFRDPWLDEAFATWAESVVHGDAAFPAGELELPEDVGQPMTAWTDAREYFATVYGKGGATLLEARERAGAEEFDAAVRCWADTMAWSIATPEDLAAALAELPEATEVLLAAGALDEDDLPG